MTTRHLLDEFGFDEFASDEVKNFHIERMDNGAFWMRVETTDGKAHVIHLFTNRSGSTVIKGLYEVE